MSHQWSRREAKQYIYICTLSLTLAEPLLHLERDLGRFERPEVRRRLVRLMGSAYEPGFGESPQRRPVCVFRQRSRPAGPIGFVRLA